MFKKKTYTPRRLWPKLTW